MSTEYRFTVRYSEPVLKEALRTFAWRRMGRQQLSLWLVAMLMLLLFVYLVLSGDRSWLLGLVGSSLLFLAAFVVAVWRAHFVNTVGRFRRMKRPQADFTLRDEDFTTTSDLGSATMPWSVIVDAWELPRCWLLFTAPNQFFTLPTDGIPQDVLAFLRLKTPRKT